MNPQSTIALLLVVKLPAAGAENGFFDLIYFDEAPSGRDRSRFTHRILVSGDAALRIEVEEELSGVHKRNRLWIPAEPLRLRPNQPAE